MLIELTNKMKKRKGFGLMDLGLYAIAITILVAAGVTAWNGYQEGNKRAVAQQELRSLADACAIYQAYNRTSAVPANLGALVTGLTAAQSNDGVAKTSFVTKSTWTTDSTTFTDPWGNAYVYAAATRTISSTNNGGVAITVTF